MCVCVCVCVVLLQHGKYHTRMPVARMYLHITRTHQGDENCYIIFTVHS